MLIKFYVFDQGLIETSSHQCCLSIGVGDHVKINGTSYRVNQKHYVDPQLDRDLEIYLEQI